MNIERFLKHPNYKADTLEYDVALIELKTDIPFYQYPNIRPVSLL